ncbi:MAG: CARDB domain-containing protein [Marinicellaceae bacterium]
MKNFTYAIILLLLAPIQIVQAFIGDIQYSINTGVGRSIAFDNSNNQFLSFGGGGILYYDYTGTFVKRIDMTGQPNVSFVFENGFSIFDNQRLVGVGNLNGLLNQLSIWRIELDGNNQETLVLESAADLSAYGTIRYFNRSPDGTYWFLNNNSDTLNHLSANFTLLFSIDIQVPFVGITGQSGSNNAFTPSLTVESNTGNLILVAKGNFIDESQLSNLATETAVYYLNPTDLSIIGRFQADLTHQRGYAASNGLLYYSNTAEVTGYELSATQSPSLNNFESDLRGFAWRQCEIDSIFSDFNSDPTVSVSVDWVDNNDGILAFKGSNVILTPSILSPEQNFELSYGLNDNTLQINPIPQGQIELVNEDDQTSGLIDVEFDFTASYAQGFHTGFSSSCSQYGYSEESVLGGGEIGKWTLARKYPNTPINVSIEFDEAFPFLGGKTFGVNDLQLDFEAGLVGQGTDKVTMSGGGTFKVGIGEIGFKAGLGTTTELTQDAIIYDKGLFNFQIAGILKAEQPLLEVIPPLAALANTPFIGRVLKVITNSAKAVAEINLSADTTVLASVPDGLLSNLCIEGKEELTLGLKVGVVIELLEGIAELSVFGGGNSKVSWQSLPDGCPDMAFNEFVIQMYLTGRYVLYGATAVFEQVHSIKYPFPTNKNSVKSESIKDSWEYAYQGTERANKSAIIPQLVNSKPFETIQLLNAKGSSGATSQLPIISGIGQDAKPVASMAPDGTAMILWIQERSDLPPTQATDIFYSYYNGQSFTPPAAISFDTRADFQPVIAYHKSGNWIAAWTHVRDTNLSTTGDVQLDAVAQSRQLSPVYSVFNPSNLTWTAPTGVPDIFVNNTFVDIIENGTSYMLTVATGPQNELALLWLTNPEQDVLPFDIEEQSITSNNFVYWSLFDGNEFSLTGTVRQGSSTQFRALDLTGSFTGEELLVGFSRAPLKGFFSAFYIYRAETPTSPFVLFERPPSPGFIQGGHPKILALSDGRTALASSSGNGINMRYGTQWDQLNNGGFFYQDSTCVKSDCSDVFFDSFVLGETDDNLVYALVPEIRNGNPDVVLTVEDPNAAPVSLNGLFDGGAIAEKYMSSSINSKGDLVMFYYQAQLEQDTVTLDLGEGEQQFQRTTEPSNGRIMLAIHEINTNLTVTNVNHTNGLSEAGQVATAYATVFNNGDKSIENPKISLYARDIGSIEEQRGDDITLVENFIAKKGWLGAGEKVEVSFPWTLPNTTEYQIYAIVDPDNDVNEFDETDNQEQGPKIDLIYYNGFEINE